MSFTHTYTLRKRLLQGTATAGLAALILSPGYATAQTEDQIIVTGTRVERQNLQAPSPVTAISAETLALTNTINAEQFINSLPQLVPAFDGTSNNPGNGTATVNLRGLGTNRTLVLVNGSRYVSAFGNGVVDLNSIPASLVKRVDIVSGGASAVYGSDAMAGVVNFILEDEFEGFEVDASYQSTGQGDGGTKNIGVTMGGNFDNGRGNATVFVGYSQRDEVFAGARDFANTTLVDNGTGFSPGGSSGVPGSRVFDNNFNYADLGFYTGPINPLITPNTGTANGGFAVTSSCGAGSNLRDPDGSTVFAAGTNPNPTLSGDEFCGGNITFDSSGNIIPWVNAGANTTRYNYAPVNYLQVPQERFTMAAFSTYDVTDTITAKIRGIFTSNNVPLRLAPTPMFQSVTIDVATNPFLTAAQRTTFTNAAIAGGQSPNAYAIYIGRRMEEIGPRNSNQELDSYQISGDLSGQWSEDWDWDIHAHLSRTNGVQIQTGNVSISAFKAAVGNGTCNVFGQGSFSQACVGLVARTGTIQNTTQQNSLVATTDGPVNAIQSPAAMNPLQIVLGAEYREENYDLRPDSVLGPDVSGFNQALPISGRYDSYEVFGEAYMPLIEGKDFAEELSLNGAYRYSDYSTVGGVNSYAVGAEWAPVADVRFRGQIQRAVRAPNVVELFAPITNGFPTTTDPCSAQPGPNGTTLPATASATACATLTTPGVPAALYNTQFQANTQLPGLFGGNTALNEESSDTFTIGFVAQPSAIPGLTLTVDYYDIEVQDAIGTVPSQTLVNDCYSGAVPGYCAQITRSPAGLVSNLNFQNQNLSLLTAKGVDVELGYGFEADAIGLAMLGGEFNLSVIGGYKIETGFQGTETSQFFDCAGYFGARGTASCGEPNPEWKHTATLRHAKGPLLNSLRWRYIGGTDADDPLSGGNPATLFVNSFKAFNYFDWTTQWDISDHFQLSGGILNMFDKQPPLLGDCCAPQSNTYPSTYDPLGRQFFVAGKMRF